MRDLAIAIARRVQEEGGRAYYVGGYVRDRLLGIDNKDIDIEIHGISIPQMEAILDEFGERKEEGLAFGVYGLKNLDMDIALPRKETAVGKGHKDFAVTVDPFLGSRQAAIRRDFTINALMEDILTGEIQDHFQGLEDLKKRRIRHVNAESFVEDPLRVFRGVQFAARFEFTMAEDTIALCACMDTGTLARERVFGEMKKALLKADRPSIFFEELRKMKQLSIWYPEVEALIDIPQNTDYHREGDVWVHTMMTLDQAASCRDLVKEPLYFMLAALCHDFGKAVATEVRGGKIHAYGHEVKGIPLARRFLERISGQKQMIDYVLNMVELHMKPHMMGYSQSAVKKTNKMFDQSVAAVDLIYLSECDARSTIGPEAFTSRFDFLMERYHLYEEYMARPYVMGRDLIQAGLKPTREFTDILAYAHKLRLAGVEKENALVQTLAYARKH